MKFAYGGLVGGGVQKDPEQIWAYLFGILFNSFPIFTESAPLRVEFFLKTDSGYTKDTGFTLFTLATPGNPLCYNTHWSVPTVSALAHSRGPRKRSQSPVDKLEHISLHFFFIFLGFKSATQRPRTRFAAARPVSNAHERDFVTNQNV